MVRCLSNLKLCLTAVVFAFCSNSLQAQTWSSPPVTLSSPPPTLDANSADIAVSLSGNFVATWYGNDPLNLFIVQATASSDGGATWSPPYTLSPPSLPSQTALNPQVVASLSGDFVVVWEWGNTATNTNVIQASKSTDGGLTWSSPSTISVSGVNSFSADIAVSASGRYVTTWKRGSNPNFAIQASTSLDGITWSAPVTVKPVVQTSGNPKVAVDPSGNFVITWSSHDGANFRVQSSMSSNGALWSSPADLSAPLENGTNPEVVANLHGRFVVVWNVNDVGVKKIKASSSADGLNWSVSPAELTPISATFISFPQIAADPSGIFTAVWPSTIGGVLQVRSSSSTDGVNWSPVVDISSPADQGFASQIESNPQGGFISVWRGGTSPNNIIRASISENGITWSTPSSVSPTGDNSDPQVAFSIFGRAVTIWEHDPSFIGIEIQSAYASFLYPPSSASGKKIKNRFLTQTEYVNQLQWNPSPDGNVVAYRIYRDGLLIATVPFSVFSYNDHRGANKSACLYGIAAVNRDGEESSPIQFTVQ